MNAGLARAGTTGAMALVMALPTTGCDAWFRVRGVVRADPGCPTPGQAGAPAAEPPTAGAATTGAPVEGAEVRLVCGEYRYLIGESDADGRVRAGGGGTLADDCHIEVSHPGYHPQIFRPSELCAMSNTFIDLTQCHALAIDARLVPRATPVAPATPD